MTGVLPPYVGSCLVLSLLLFPFFQPLVASFGSSKSSPYQYFTSTPLSESCRRYYTLSQSLRLCCVEIRTTYYFSHNFLYLKYSQLLLSPMEAQLISHYGNA